MTPGEARHQVIRALLQAQEPLTEAELLARCAAPERDVRSVLADLVGGGQVVEGRLLAGGLTRRSPLLRDRAEHCTEQFLARRRA